VTEFRQHRFSTANAALHSFSEQKSEEVLPVGSHGKPDSEDKKPDPKWQQDGQKPSPHGGGGKEGSGK
jgi:hypothetical protein